MLPTSRLTRYIRILAAFTFATCFVVAFSLPALAAVPIVQISSDPFTNTTSQHQTETEPDTYSFGSTIVSAFQVGRFTDGGSSDIGFATSTNNGATWTDGFLPGITKIVNPANPFDRVSDATVAFDAAHNTWLIASLAITASGGNVVGAAVIVNRSTDGGLTWGNPVTVHAASGAENLDKDWIVCDDTASSAFFGHCYVEWDNNGAGNLIQMSTSTNGGTSWGAALATANSATGLGGQPVVQPNGTVIVPIDNAGETAVLAFRSTNGGTSWTSTTTVATIRSHTEAGSLRSSPLITAEIDGRGTVYVVWGDCRFERGCPANDLVLTTSTNGTTWTAVRRIPADAVGSGVDHFIPGLAVDKTTSGTTAHLVVVYYFYPVSNCTSATCQLDVGSSSSLNGGSSWSAATMITGPMTLSWLPNTTEGRMVADYISTSFVQGGKAFPAFASASAPSGGSDCSVAGVTCHEGTFTTAAGLAHSQNFIAVQDDRINTSVSPNTLYGDSPHPGTLYRNLPQQSTGNGDTLYGDSPHPDTLYGDSPHPNTLYGDSPQQGTIYGILPQQGSGNGDTLYGDSPQQGSGNGDTLYGDSPQQGTIYGILPQQGTGNGDTLYGDSPHPDTLYGDSPHSDVIYGDAPHQGTIYGNLPKQEGVIYGDAPHPDTLYGDSPQQGSGNGDTLYGDSPQQGTLYGDGTVR